MEAVGRHPLHKGEGLLEQGAGHLAVSKNNNQSHT